jgi:hypothetical protein
MQKGKMRTIMVANVDDRSLTVGFQTFSKWVFLLWFLIAAVLGRCSVLEADSFSKKVGNRLFHVPPP